MWAKKHFPAPLWGLIERFLMRSWCSTTRRPTATDATASATACFSHDEPAIRFAQEALGSIPGIVLRSMTFHQAREVAKSRPLPVVAVILLDDPDDPLVHYVR